MHVYVSTCARAFVYSFIAVVEMYSELLGWNVDGVLH